MDFVHLINHSEFSMLQSSLRTKGLMGKVKDFEQKAVALTDHGVMFGALEFYFNATWGGLKPIIGCEIYIDFDNVFDPSKPVHSPLVDRVVLLAETQEGYDNLMKIVTFGWIDHYRNVPLITRDILEKNAPGLIALYGGMTSLMGKNFVKGRDEIAPKNVEQLLNYFDKEHLYLMLQDHHRPEEKGLIEKTVRLANSLELPIVATNNNHYLNKEDAEAHSILCCIRAGEKIKEFENEEFPTSEYYVKSSDEMVRLFADYPQAIENTVLIAERCNIHIDDNVGDKYWPKFQIPPEFDNADDYLAHITWEKRAERYPELTDEVKERVQFELDIMKEMKVSAYMLIVQDFINWARDNDIPVGPGRGSAVGSAVCYIIGITDVEPIQFGLLFERFLNPERVSMPDIDTDFSDKDREKVIQYCTQKYGRECVSQIVTYGSMKAKAVLRDVARVLGIAPDEIDPIAKIIPVLGYDLKKSWDEFAELREIVESRELYKKMWKFALNLEGLKRQPGIHAAAVIIAPSPLVELAPLYKAPGEESVVIQYDKTFAEDVGFLKMDFLGLRNLSVIKDALKMVKENHGVDIDPLKIDICDPKTYELLGKGLTVGVFQFESPGMQEYLRKLKPSTLEDMIAMNALYRPGPIENIPRFIDCKHGIVPIDCYHEDFESFLGETYGVIVYQEQVMLLAQKLAGFTLGGADLLRRAMAKKKQKEMDKLIPLWMDGAEERGYGRPLAEKLWEVLIPFCNYAFNKSHSAAYAFVGYQTAFLKANYTAEFMAANLSSELDNTERLVILLEDCKDLNIGILPPDINRSEGVFTVKDQKINYGLAGIKGVGLQIIIELIEERKANGEFKTLFDLTKRMAKCSAFNKRTLESLIMAGACDSFPGSRAELHASSDLALEYGSQVQKEIDMGQVNLFGAPDDSSPGMDMVPDLLEVSPWTHTELLGKEKEVMGLYVTGHPLEEFAMELEGLTDSTLLPERVQQQPLTESSYKGDENGTLVIFGGVLNNLKQMVNSKTNMAFAIGTLEDFHGKIEAAFWPTTFEKFREIIANDSMVLVEAFVKKKRDSEALQLDVQNVVPIEDARRKWSKYIKIKLDTMGMTEDDLRELEMICEDFQIQGEGLQLLFQVVSKNKNQHLFQSNRFVLSNELDLIHEFQDLFGKENIKLSKKIRSFH